MRGDINHNRYQRPDLPEDDPVEFVSNDTGEEEEMEFERHDNFDEDEEE